MCSLELHIWMYLTHIYHAINAGKRQSFSTDFAVVTTDQPTACSTSITSRQSRLYEKLRSLTSDRLIHQNTLSQTEEGRDQLGQIV